METYDIVVIGGGPGGYPAAIRAAQVGAKVALVEREALGGTCLNWGCIPTKTLIASAEIYARAKGGAALGIRGDTVGFDYAAMVARKDQVVGRLKKGVETLLAGNGVKVYAGAGAFQGRNRIAVTPAGGGAPEVLEARKTIVATGSTSVMPGFLPKHPRVVESRSFLDRKGVPETAIVLGGGIIGCEFACLLAALGAKVTVVELLEDLLFMLDADVRKELRRHMEGALGIRVLTGKPLEQVQATDKAVKGRFGGETLEAELLLCAIGRRPVTDGLSADNAGLKPNAKGFIEVDAHGQTSAATVYAIGDVTGGVQLAHAATSQGIVAAEHALGHGRRANERVIPSCLFTAPEIGLAGLGEAEAAKDGRKVVVGKFPFSALGKALAIGETAGFAKWIVDAETDRLLGAAVVGPHATDLIAEAAAAIRAELTAREIGRTIHAHPTLSEIWMEAAHAVHGEAIHAAPRRKTKA
jgi:dihydrolipoamide dehydrogenase